MVDRVFRASLLVWLCLTFSMSVTAQCLAPSFNAAINLEAGDFPSDIASGDFNSDGRTDLVIPNFTTNTILVFLGNATGGPTLVKVTSVQQPNSVGVADFNHDGKMDIAISRGFKHSSASLAILLGDGAAGFSSPTDFVANVTDPLVIADFNNDNHADIFLGDTNGGADVFLGNGSGGFGTRMVVFLDGLSEAVAADFNHDGKIDLATAHDGAVISVYLGDGTGHFGAAARFPVSRARFIATADFNSDGHLDLVTTTQNDGVSILLGNGAGTFGAATIVSTGFQVHTLAVGDFNGDGKPDLVATAARVMATLAGNGNGGFGPHIDYSINGQPIDIVVGDFNGDSKVDVATANRDNSTPFDNATVLFGDGAGRLRYPSVLASGLSPYSITHGDVNGDGKSDLAVANIGHNNVSIWLSDGVGGFIGPVNFAVGSQPRSVTLGDLNNDQKLDMVTANYDGGTVSVLLGNGQGVFSAPINFSVPGFNPAYAAIGDFNNDGKPDLAVAYLSANSVSILLGDGVGGFGLAGNFPVPSGAQSIAINDFNGDGKSDLAVATITGVAVLLGNGSGGFGVTNTIQTNSTSYSVAAGDFNGDGKADLATSLGNINRVLVYLGDGQGGFGTPATFTAGSQPFSIVVSDFNGDGSADLATGNGHTSASVLLGNGNGGFAPAVSYLTGGVLIRAATSGDFNSDGRADLALADQFGFVHLIFNSCSAPPFSVPTLSVTDATITEADAGTASLSFSINLSAAATKTVAVSFYSAAQNASKDLDYQTTLGRVTFAPGITSQTITVPIIGDNLDEFDEQFSIFLVHPLNASISDAQGLGMILDNDPPPMVSINDVSISEGNSGTSVASFTASLSAPSGKPISLSYTTADQSAVAGADYQAVNGMVTFSPGETTKTIGVPVLGDILDEPDETFFVNLSNLVNVTAADLQGLGTILDNDPPPMVSINDLSVSEGNSGTSVANFTASLSAPSAKPISLSYATADQSAVAGVDYQAVAGTVTFSPGETNKTIAVPVLGDTLAESDETFLVNLSNLVNVTAADAQGVGTLINDDQLVLLTEENTMRAVALESVFQTRDPFSLVMPSNFYPDHRTRISLFVWGLHLLPTENISAVTVQAEDEQGRPYDLVVEYVGTVPGFGWLTQLVVKLPEEVIGVPRDLWLKVSLRGATSNRAIMKISSP